MTKTKSKNTSKKVTSKKNIKKDNFKEKLVTLKDCFITKCKSLTLKNYINIGIVLFILITSYLVFFQYKVIPFVDGQVYYRLSLIINGSFPISKWDIARGFSFPLIISGITKLFGDSQHGLLTGFYMFYLFLIFSIGYFIQKYIKQNNVKNRVSYIIMYLLLIVFNPLIIGWSHTLLVESVIPAIYMIVIMILYKWYRVNLKERKRQEIIFGVVLALLGMFIWFLKQPYAPAYFAGLFIASILSAIYFKSKKVLWQKLLTCLCCLVFMIISIFVWNDFISSYTSQSANDKNNDYISGSVTAGLNVYYYPINQKVFCTNKYVKNLDKNDQKQIERIKSKYGKKWCDHTDIYEIRKKNSKLIDVEILVHKGKSASIIENLKFVVKNMFKHPNYVFGSYLHNYLAIVDIEDVDLINGYSSSARINPNTVGENLSNGFYTYYSNNPIMHEPEEFTKHLNGTTTSNSEAITNLLLINNSLCLYLFKLLLLCCLPIFIYTFVKFVKTKENYYFLITVISFMCFINIIFNVFMGAVIDRYIYAFYPLMILCMFILFMEKNKISGDGNEK